MHPPSWRLTARRHLREGLTVSQSARLLGVARSTVRVWREDRPERPTGCPRCDGTDLDATAYALLLGYYLGDGHLARSRRSFSLRVTCDRAYPGIVDDVADAMARVRPGRAVHRVARTGCVVVQAQWRHWPCLFPQHGPGPKHSRPIILGDWQRAIVQRQPAAFLRGLLHSDGSRVANRVRRPVAGRMKHYVYPRWQFTNYSVDIRELCCWALDLVDVPWRQSNVHHISVSTRAGVARLDELIGLKR
ncbi:helix-turn-helix domain-containing protein [Nocardioides lijunqiniae]|uniref:helix-turn-helix domain-containing protein n=1 Tax=Nocardioides lijunqiniae TaxID=2760832 RepID=UPI001878FE13|nr:helix-turn-helix domain-containing protein [Nocardioides lijunqiniae]